MAQLGFKGSVQYTLHAWCTWICLPNKEATAWEGRKGEDQTESTHPPELQHERSFPRMSQASLY